MLLASLVFVHLVQIFVSPDRFIVVRTVYDKLSETVRGTYRDREPGAWEKKLMIYCFFSYLEKSYMGKKAWAVLSVTQLRL